MASQPRSQWVVPNTGIPRTFGLLNVIFGVLLLLGGIGSVAWVLMAPTIGKAMQAQRRETLAKANAEREARIADLKKQEAAAKTEAEKEQLRTEREAAESVPEPPEPPDVTIWDTYADPRYRAYFCGEVSLGIVLNIAMIVAGAGLLATAEWGRRLAIGVAWGKIVRLVGRRSSP
jgi:cell division protein FtsB